MPIKRRMRWLAIVLTSVCVIALPAQGARHAGDTATLRLSAVVGTPGPDVLNGTEGADTVRGLAGRDTLRGRGGSDRLDGGAGNDVMFGDAGNDALLAGGKTGFYDELDGGPGNDLLVSSPGGTVRLVGGPGNDVLRGSSGKDAWAADTFSGGPGNDRLLSVDTVSTIDSFFEPGCGKGLDRIELVRVPMSTRALLRRTLRNLHGCERVIFR